MSLLVVKFGGASVADIEGIKNAASKVAQEVRRGHKVVVVVSAAFGTTDALINSCKRVSPRPNPREYDAIISTGEQVSAGLLALALEQRGLNARSWMGWQVPLRTNSDFNKAHILEIEPSALHARLDEGEIAVLAGFQGVSKDGSITTLGRGGTDTSAVAVAAALQADRCDIYTKTTGVYTANPQIVSRAKKLKRISYEEMLELASISYNSMTTRSIEIAFRYGVSLQILSSCGNDVGSDLPGTLITSEDQIMENNPVTGIAHSRNVSRVTIKQVPDKPGAAAAIFGALSHAGLNVDMIVQSASNDDEPIDITFTVLEKELSHAVEVLKDEKDKIGFSRIFSDKNVAKISMVGSGMRTRPGVAALAFQTLAEKNINIQVVETSEINITILIAEEYLELAVRILHTAFGLNS